MRALFLFWFFLSAITAFAEPDDLVLAHPEVWDEQLPDEPTLLAMFYSDSPIQDFHVVDPGILRGARPGPAGVEWLKAKGVKTIIDLEDNTNEVVAERNQTAGLGIRFIEVPLSGFWSPSDRDTAVVQEALANPSNYPIYIHCQHGHDRTGLMVGLFRVFHDHWTTHNAYQEMLADGFHPILLGLSWYWHHKTDDHDERYEASLE